MMPALAPFFPSLERPGGTHDFAVVVLLGILAEVPDIAFLVLGIPIEGLLLELTIEEDPIENDGHGNAENSLVTQG